MFISFKLKINKLNSVNTSLKINNILICKQTNINQHRTKSKSLTSQRLIIKLTKLPLNPKTSKHKAQSNLAVL